MTFHSVELVGYLPYIYTCPVCDETIFIDQDAIRPDTLIKENDSPKEA